MATILCRTRLGVVLMLAPEYEVDVTTRNEVMADFTLIHYMLVLPSRPNVSAIV